MPADEFDIIKRLFAPLAIHPGARGLIDDVAVLEVNGALVITADAIVEGVHFRASDPIAAVAKKALRVNLSDLAAKGAKPVGAMLSLIWPDARPAAQIEDFARGLGEDLRLYGVALLGGDTCATSGPLTIAITAFGQPLGVRTPSRADARPGEDIWITGTVGDAWLGFEQSDRLNADHRAFALARTRLPEPRTAFAAAIARLARAAMDISDGLEADALKLAEASGAMLRIDADRIPLSAAARAWLAGEAALSYGRLFTWGDDYEIFFTADPRSRGEIAAAAEAAGVQVTRIGEVAPGSGLILGKADGTPLRRAPSSGHRHRLGR